MSQNFRVIGLTGRARCGKDTLASMLEANHSFVRVGLADPLRNFVAGICQLSTDDLMDSAVKEDPNAGLLGSSPRRLMQTLGTEWGRQIVGEGVWLEVADRAIRAARQSGAAGVVISDVRFNNEAKFVADRWGGYIARLTRNGSTAVEYHASEAGIDERYVNYHIDNNGPKSALAAHAAGLAGAGFFSR